MNHTDLSTELAIIGMAGRFPQATNLDQFWEKLREGTELISFFSDEELKAAGADAQLLNHPNFVGFDTDLRNGSFGTLNTAQPAREIQLGLKFIF